MEKTQLTIKNPGHSCFNSRTLQHIRRFRRNIIPYWRFHKIMEEPSKAPQKKIIYFDGVCNLCNSTVKWVLRHDTKAAFSFASLQSEFAQANLANANGQGIKTDSVVYQDGDRFYYRSDAVLKILEELGSVWQVFLLFKILPKAIRDRLYQFVARHRYQWFGKMDACILPDDKLKGRFLE